MTDMQTLRDARQSKKPHYEVRTRYLAANGEPVYINELIFERSPYLLQHAHNPVNWHRWCDQTFLKARQENKPVFLSIGYSTCHWCHVMEEESFDDEETAALLNQHFIAIKVDREQRPDIDNIYMTAVQLITGRGGWPMSVFLTPEGQPFYGATYFQKPHFMRLLDRIQTFWRDDREQLYGHATQLTDAITNHLAPPPEIGVIPEELIPGVCDHLLASADSLHGGFGDAPKFPQEAHLLFLLDQLARQPKALTDQPVWRVVKHALDAMLQGGIYDQLAGGFHRYSTDSYWLVPHFEKMLYNQGQLVRVYSQAFQLCKDPEYQRIACETLDYVLKEMRTESGLFFSATDADSEGEEGKFFVWTLDQLKQSLPDDDLKLIETAWGVKSRGNFEGANVLFLPKPLQEAARVLGMSYSSLVERLETVKATLYSQRQQRVPPLTDTKIITEWNGMIIAALAEASRIFGRPDYMRAAITATEQLWYVQRHSDGSLWRISMDNMGSENALLEDYAHLMEALLEIYEGTGQAIFLERCQALCKLLQNKYWDDSQGGYFVSPRETDGPMLVRSKNLSDNATICGNSQMLLVLNRLWQTTGDAGFSKIRREHIAAFAETVSQQSFAALMFLRGLAGVQAANSVCPQYFGGGQIQVRIDQATQLDDRLTLSLCIRLNNGWHIQGPDAVDSKTLGFDSPGSDTAGSGTTGSGTSVPGSSGVNDIGLDSHGADNNRNKAGRPGDGLTRISLLSDHTLIEIVYPPAAEWLTQDGRASSAVYKESCYIIVRVQCQSAAPVRLNCQLQACYEKACMAPEVKEIVYWPAI